MDVEGGQKDHTTVKTLLKLVRKRLTAGLLVVGPLGVTFLVLRILYRFTASILTPPVRRLFGGLPEFAVGLLAVLVLVMLLYLVGLMAANLLGRRMIAWGERLVDRVPIAGTVYSATKQVVEALGTTERSDFRSVVMVEFPQKGSYTIGFCTGRIRDEQGRELAKVIIPTSPNPATGFFELIPSEKLRELDLSVEDAIKLVVSGGIIAPKRLTRRGSAPSSTDGPTAGSPPELPATQA